MTGKYRSPEDRAISFASGLPAIPERLLLAHARGEVLFICGAGVSMPAGLPDFRKLVLDTYKSLDRAVHDVLSRIPVGVCNRFEIDCSGLTDGQAAEVRRFHQGDYDVVLGMLERRLDNTTHGDSRVRREIAAALRSKGGRPAPIHSSLMRLADRGGVITIVTTNFDLLLETSLRRGSGRPQTYALGAMPRPSRHAEFAGVLHIHGALESNPARASELVLSDRDFGEFYLRRRLVPDFIYDAARLFHLVLVGYSANDAPMRYLLNAVAADGSRFDDLKERFTFFGTDVPDAVAVEDWKARGITPIHYDARDRHRVLGETLEIWSRLSAVNGSERVLDAKIRRIVKFKRADANEVDRDLFDHLVRRGNAGERTRLARVAASASADLGWLDAITAIAREPARR